MKGEYLALSLCLRRELTHLHCRIVKFARRLNLPTWITSKGQPCFQRSLRAARLSLPNPVHENSRGRKRSAKEERGAFPLKWVGEITVAHSSVKTLRRAAERNLTYVPAVDCVERRARTTGADYFCLVSWLGLAE